MSLSKFSVRGALVGLLAAVPFTSAHTWIEQMMVIAPNGTLVGEPGFARGNVLRGSAGFSDPTMVNLIPPDGRTINEILSTDLMCKSSQTSQTQTDGSPRLQAAPGSAVALRYQENGHVTLPDNQPGKPQNRGTVYVYGTTQPSPDDAFLAIHRVWNANGTGGDGRGVLLSTQNFDDGQCYQVNGGTISQQRQKEFSHPTDTLMGADLWCQQDIEIPSTAPTGQPYTLYWVWDWPTLPGTSGFPNGKQEIYTTCMDVDIVDSGSSSSSSEAFSKEQVSFDAGQPLDNAAVSAELQDISNPTAVTGKILIPFAASVNASSSSQQQLTFSGTGSTIPFSASATGPVPGGASEASAVAATSTETGVPAFLSVHTNSVTGPGVETQTFSVVPISVTFTTTTTPDSGATVTAAAAATTAAAQTQQTGHSGGSSAQTTSGSSGSGHGSGGNGSGQGSRFGNGTSSFDGNDDNAPADAAVAVATFTDYQSITQTVFETVYQTKYTKRAEGQFSLPVFTSLAQSLTSTPEPAPTAAPAAHIARSPFVIPPVAPEAPASTAHPAFRLRARNPFAAWFAW